MIAAPRKTNFAYGTIFAGIIKKSSKSGYNVANDQPLSHRRDLQALIQRL
jgi:hypothetical protein